MKRKIVTSPRLVLDSCLSNYYLVGDASNMFWCCFSGLREFIELPYAKYYWLQASNEQWADRSGTRVEARLLDEYEYDGEEAECLAGGRWCELCSTVVPSLKRLGVRLGLGGAGPPKTIYVRLLYEE